jgi:hypothetical protein
MSTPSDRDPHNDKGQPIPPSPAAMKISPGAERSTVRGKGGWVLIALIGLGALLTITWMLWLGYAFVRLGIGLFD